MDDFESVKVSAWEGVRNYEARNLMKEMKVGEKVSSLCCYKGYMQANYRRLYKVLFYHSNCKTPGDVPVFVLSANPDIRKLLYTGIAGFAEASFLLFLYCLVPERAFENPYQVAKEAYPDCKPFYASQSTICPSLIMFYRYSLGLVRWSFFYAFYC